MAKGSGEPSVARSMEIYERARQIIPGVSQLISRQPTRAALGYSPIYAERAKGCRIWDVDGNEYVDWMSGVGPIILGYADDVVDGAVRAQIERGSVYSVLHESSVELAELLVRLIPSAEMVHYAKGGGEACTVAVRMARGVTGRDKVLFCGYHGWHDWYIAANPGGEKLASHLLPGIEPTGVPACLEGTAIPFQYGDADMLADLLDEHADEVACIIMEPMRTDPARTGTTTSASPRPWPPWRSSSAAMRRLTSSGSAPLSGSASTALPPLRDWTRPDSVDGLLLQLRPRRGRPRPHRAGRHREFRRHRPRARAGHRGRTAEEPHVWGTLTERDSVICHDNDFEIFIDPDGDGERYMEFEINPLNTVWDLFLPKAYNKGGQADWTWDFEGIRHAVQVDGTLNWSEDVDCGWTVEVAIPWDSMAANAATACPPRGGDQWRVNFSRVEYEFEKWKGGYTRKEGIPCDNWVWSPQGAINMHLPEMWGYVQFSELTAGCGTEEFRPT